MSRRAVLVLLVLLVGPAVAYAHVPFLERKDFGHGNPFTPEIPRQSIAVYAWLESADDVDYYVFEIKKKTPFLAEVLVPVYPQYKRFRPSFALIGKGLPKPPKGLPVTPHPGYGVLVFHDDAKTRKRFYEPFGGKHYYQGPRLERTLEPGIYALVYWDPQRAKGDYVAVIGKKEIWRARDMGRALAVTPLIRRGKELHLTETKPKAKATKAPVASKPRK